MTTKQIAARLVKFCRKGEFEAAQKELYADDAVSLEPAASPAFKQRTKGLPAILKKGAKFEGMVEKMHRIEVSDPVVAGKSFACTLLMDLTMKGQKRMKMTELCVYEVKDEKIVSEQFHF